MFDLFHTQRPKYLPRKEHGTFMSIDYLSREHIFKKSPNRDRPFNSMERF